MKRASLFLFVATLVSTAAPSTAFAQPDTPAESDNPNAERARQLFQEGNAAYRERNWELAYTKFKEAFGLAPTYDLAGNLGDVELMLNKPREAAEHLAYSLKNWPAGQAEARAKTEARLKEAKGFVATIKVKVNKDGAEVFVNGASVGTSPIAGELFVNPGAITVEAKADGKSDKSTIALDKGGMRSVTLTLGDGAGGNGNGEDPSGDGGTNGTGTVKKPPLFPAFIGGGVALVGLGAGILFLSKAGSAQDDADSASSSLPNGNPCAGANPPAACADLKSANEDVDKNKNLATVGFVTLGVGAAFTAGYLIWRESAATTTARSATPTVSVGPRRLSLSVVGRF